MVVTGSRADWGYLSVPVKLMRQNTTFDVALVVTGQHLDPQSGNSLEGVEREGGPIAERVLMTPHTDAAPDIIRAMGEGLAGFGAVIAGLRPHLMLLLGDRYETLAAASAGLVARIPMAHIAGGDISEGAIDDAIRHAITKLAHLHFPTNAEAARRIAQMGENPARIHCVGSTGLDRLLQVKIMPRPEFFEAIGRTPRTRNLLITMHPVTLAGDPLGDAAALLAALENLDEDIGLIFTGSNADEGGRQLSARVRDFTQRHPNASFHPSLGTDLYVNALAHCEAVIGNSSSGFYEAPSMCIPTVNIGRRQDGRLRAASVIDTAAEPEAILAAITKALAIICRSTVNPYGDGMASQRMISILQQLDDPAALLNKNFYRGSTP